MPKQKNNTQADSRLTDKCALRVARDPSDSIAHLYDRKIIRSGVASARRSIPSSSVISRLRGFYPSIYPRGPGRCRCKVERARARAGGRARRDIAPRRTSWISSFQHFSVLRTFEALIPSLSLSLPSLIPSLLFRAGPTIIRVYDDKTVDEI